MNRTTRTKIIIYGDSTVDGKNLSMNPPVTGSEITANKIPIKTTSFASKSTVSSRPLFCLNNVLTTLISAWDGGDWSTGRLSIRSEKSIILLSTNFILSQLKITH